MTEKNLGRGLSAFLNEPLFGNDKSVVSIDVSLVKRNPFQPRQVFSDESLDFLAQSIKRNGVIQPILVIKLNDGSYQLVAGERRLKASKIAGLKDIPAIVTNMKEEEQLEVAILENIQREDLNPLEEAEAYRRLIEEFNHTQEELAGIVGKSRSHVSNTLRILSLPDDVKSLIREGKLSFGHARALVGTENAVSIAKQAVSQSLNVRETENMVRQQKSNYQDPEISTLAGHISTLIGLNANIKLKGKGGVVEINFNNFEELDSFVQKLN
ncbi:MAG: ParB/RepB/Spo0J family partition protein [Holosporaceae bacterium]|jgi:ParB family chromosome partitioning protein|nr:ParB/RepB/Spo0J family partition protein [Holosporaceae bacterium]